MWPNEVVQEETWEKKDISHNRACEGMSSWDVRKPTFIPFWLIHEGFVLQLMGWEVISGDLLLLESLFVHFAHKRLHLPLDLKVCC